MKYDIIVVGAGFFGSSFARLATDAGKSCLVVDKRNHVAGMACDEIQKGIPVSLHGAHIFHTDIDATWEFANRFAKFNTFINKPKARCGNDIFSFPINMMTFHQLWGVCTPEEAIKKLNEVRVPCERPRNAEEWCLSVLGREIYEKFIYGYTKKQWFCEPSELPCSIVQRLKFKLSYDENYFCTKYQGMPIGGYSQMVLNMLCDVDVRLGQDFFEMGDWRKYAKHLVYTGPLDKFFDYKFGELDYRTLKFTHEEHKGDFQGNAVINWCDPDVPQIRTIEHKHFYSMSRSKHDDIDRSEAGTTIVSYDLPAKWEETKEPYYPLRDEYNTNLCNKYRKLAADQKDVTFGGRLGEYKYYDIDQTMASAMSKVKNLV